MSSNKIEIFDDWDEPVLLVDSVGVIRHANNEACEAFGYTLEQFVGRTLQSLAPESQDERSRWVRAMFTRPTGSGPHGPGVVICVGRDGTHFAASATFETAHFGEQGWVWVLLDISSPTASTRNGDLVSGSAFPGRFSWGETLESIRQLESSFEHAAMTLSETVDFDVMGVSTIDQGAGSVKTCQRYARSGLTTGRSLGTTFSIKGTIAEAVATNRAPTLVAVSNIDEYRRVYPGDFTSGYDRPYLSTLAVPLFSGSDVTGMAYMHSKKEKAFASEDIATLAQATVGEVHFAGLTVSSESRSE